MKNIFIYIGLALVVAGAAVGALTGIPAAQWIELAACAVGLATCVISIVKKDEKRDWKLWVALAAVSVGTILLVWAGISDSIIQSVITAVIALVVLVTGLLPVLFKKE